MPRSDEAGPRHRDRPSSSTPTSADNCTASVRRACPDRLVTAADLGAEQDVVRHPSDRRAVWGPMRVQAHTVAQERRARVLAHPDLAQQLTAEPLGHARPEEWNGYVPPASWRERGNDSPRRVALVALCAEALQRDCGR